MSKTLEQNNFYRTRFFFDKDKTKMNVILKEMTILLLKQCHLIF